MGKLGITVVAKAKHRAIHAAVKKLGGVRNLAIHLGVSYFTVFQWLSLKGGLPSKPNHWYPQARLDALEEKLIALTGETLEQLFPPELQAKALAGVGKEREFHQDIDLARLSQYRPELLALPDGEKMMMIEEVSAIVKEAMKYLTFRQRKVIEMRYGIGENRTSYTLEECAKELNITRERIRQIESKAIRRMKGHPEVGCLFKEIVPDQWTEPPRDFSAIDAKFKQ